MGLFGKKKKKLDDEAQALNARLMGGEADGSDGERPAGDGVRLDFWRDAVRSLLLFIRELVLDINEIEPQKFREKLDAVLEKVESGGRAQPPAKRFERHKIETVSYTHLRAHET